MKRPGFSLIEMMIAVLVIGLGLVTLLSVTGSALQVVRTAREVDTARVLLDREELRLPTESTRPRPTRRLLLLYTVYCCGLISFASRPNHGRHVE